MNIQIYLTKKNFDAQKAERFFKERRIPYQLVDMKKHAPGMRELKLFAAVLGAENLPDRSRSEVLSHPIAYTANEDTILSYLSENISLIRSPIVRNGNKVTLGVHEDAWKQWLNE